ncbi:MAG TPA: pilus assembly PilX N-terminal domain-containing protein [Sedimentisphaerales bacterium]|nr:pilus assembly PilX N-terminal domain-containing protein [Sedimentisphaerales bacterium]
MAPVNKSVHPKREGAVLIVAMIFVLIFSALAVSMATMSGTNAQLASNHHKVDCALGSATSGLEVQRHWLTPISMPSSTPINKYFSTIMNTLEYNLDANSISNITLIKHNGTISPVTLDSTTGQTFSGQMHISDSNSNILEVFATGGDAQITRTIKVDFDIEPYKHPIFNYGLATKGPLNYTGNPLTTGANESWEADIYIESSGSDTAVFVAGNTNFHGDIMIGNPDADVSFGGDVLIDGDHGETAIDNHVFIGVEPVDFPEPDTARFGSYATGITIDSSTDLSAAGANILVNAKIAAGTNPVFTKGVTIQGILLIESPNVVTFASNVDLQGIIVGEGDVTANPVMDRIDVLGNFSSGTYPSGAEFDAIRQEVGSSIVAPGFAMSFQGNFSTLEGVVAVSGVTFSGNVAAQIKGTIINYSETPMIIEGNASMTFDREASTKIPAGFDTLRVLTYKPSSYDEVAL